MCKNKRQQSKKRKILLSTLIPCSLVLIGLSCGLGFGLGCKSNTTVFKSVSDINKYLEKHEVIHNESSATWTTKNDSTMLSWLWDRNNYGKQNMINSLLTGFKTTAVKYEFKCTLNTGNDFFKSKFYVKYENQSANWFYNIYLTHQSLRFESNMFPTNSSQEYTLDSYGACYKTSSISLFCMFGVPTSAGRGGFFGPIVSEYPNIQWPIDSN